MIPRPLIAALCALTLASAAMAKIDLVVLEARGIKLNAGDVIDGSAKLTLSDGQMVTLMAEDGKTLKLRGPLDRPPVSDEKASTADVKLALQALITQESQRERSGVIRGGGTLVVPPEPWLVDVSSSGLRCLETGSTITLWRPSAAGTLPLQVAPADRSWRAQAEWEDGLDRLTLPRTVPLARRSAYVVKLGSKEVTLTLIALPTTLVNDAMRASFMMENGCDAQAKALFTAIGLPAQ